MGIMKISASFPPWDGRTCWQLWLWTVNWVPDRTEIKTRHWKWQMSTSSQQKFAYKPYQNFQSAWQLWLLI